MLGFLHRRKLLALLLMKAVWSVGQTAVGPFTVERAGSEPEVKIFDTFSLNDVSLGILELIPVRR
jgi:hypothetical protein